MREDRFCSARGRTGNPGMVGGHISSSTISKKRREYKGGSEHQQGEYGSTACDLSARVLCRFPMRRLWLCESATTVWLREIPVQAGSLSHQTTLPHCLLLFWPLHCTFLLQRPSGLTEWNKFDFCCSYPFCHCVHTSTVPHNKIYSYKHLKIIFFHKQIA